jgi:hypothetical protein
MAIKEETMLNSLVIVASRGGAGGTNMNMYRAGSLLQVLGSARYARGPCGLNATIPHAGRPPKM